MSLKRILVPFAGYASDMCALKAALTIAKTQNAHVEVWHSYKPARKARAEKGFSQAIALMKINRVDGDYPDAPSASFHVATADPAQVIAERGRVCDLIVVCPRKTAGHSRVIGSALFDTGRPLLLVPEGRKLGILNERVVVAWNGSREAAHALGFAMPILEQGKVWIVSSDDSCPIPARTGDLIPYLRQHNVDVETMPLEVKAASVPQTIIEAAKIVDAGLIVMGAYGHSRGEERVFGGVTDYIVKNTTVPVLLAH